MQARSITVLAAGVAAICVAMAIGSGVKAETIQASKFCYSSRRSTGQTLTDGNCRVKLTYGSGVDPPLNAITIHWADGYQTNIRITGGHEHIGRTTGLFFGRAVVDGEDSDFIELKSVLPQKVLHPAYQRIIGMGESAIPMLLKELEQEPNHWFLALKAITGVNPVKPESRGRIRLMAQDWLNWGREHGYCQ